MEIYFLLIFIWVIIAFSFKSEKNISILLTLFMALVIGLRDPTIGSDTLNYIYRFLNSPYLINSRSGIAEFGFTYYNIFLLSIGVKEQLYIFISSLIISCSFGFFFYKFSKNIFLSFFLNLTIGLFFMSLTGIRQMLAISITIIAIYVLEKKSNFRKFLFVILVGIAYSFHNSALCFLPILLIRNIKIQKKHLALFLGFVFSVLAIGKFIVKIINILAPKSYSDMDLFMLSKINPFVIIIAIIIPVTCLAIIWKKNDCFAKENLKDNYSFLLIMSMLNAIFVILSIYNNQLGRLGFYFVPFNMILIVNVIESVRDRNTKYLYRLLCVIFPLIQMIIAIPDGRGNIGNYIFFWQ